MRVLHLRRVILPSRNKAMIRVTIYIPPMLTVSKSQNRELRGVKRTDAAIVLVIARRPRSTAIKRVLHKY